MIRLGQKYRITHIGYQSRNGVFERVQSFKLGFGEGSLQLGYLQSDKLQTEYQYFDIDDVEDRHNPMVCVARSLREQHRSDGNCDFRSARQLTIGSRIIAT